ncbi:A-agglutinin anchorage subunit-like [Haliotis rubra]|uniref:A-agglutinin anchorage subunit-like n=1 Tax=Haliotis rubra TaxID=36100 RepID=UPI001EE4EF11|nr:A-agglutinin anchorage subunit-like [Haliotis rubra]
MASLSMVLIYSIMLWSAQFVTVSTESPCPAIARLSGSYDISAKIVYDRFVWVRPSDSQYVVTCSPQCSGTTTYSATQKNAENITTLTIGRVQIRDAGTWVISNTSSATVPACHLTVAGPPECDISSSRNGSLIPGTSLTLTVNITNYYCTEEAAFDLITGSVQQELVPRHHVVDINSTVVSKTFEVTSAHDGDIKINFKCDGTQRELSCSGDKKIIVVGATSTATPPTSTPASSPTTSTSTGSDTTTTSISSSITTSISTSTSIATSITTSTTTPPTPASVPVYLIIGIVIVLLVLLIIIFVLIVFRNRIARVARKYSVTRKRPKVRNLKENDKPNKGKRMSQINPDKKADFDQNVLGSTADPASEDKGASVKEMAI